MKIRDLHEDILRHPFPVYDEAMRSVFPERHQFNRYLAWKGNLHHLYLWALVRILKPAKILELGTGIGTGAFFMMCALPPCSRLITVELHPAPPPHLGFWDADPRLTKVIGDDLDLRIYGDLDLGETDLLFIDSDHQAPHVERQWDAYRSFLAPGAVAVFDDIHLNVGMSRFWDALAGEKIDTGNAIHESGFGLWRALS
jgi:predicted O-methyltransferase YrrM